MAASGHVRSRPGRAGRLRWRPRRPVLSLLGEATGLGSGDLPGSAIPLLRALDSDDASAAATLLPDQPLLVARLRALRAFAHSRLATEDFDLPGYAGEPIEDAALERSVAALVESARRHEATPLAAAAMRFLAHGGCLVLGAERCVRPSESKKLLTLLFTHFTDEPEAAMPADGCPCQSEIDSLAATLRADAPPHLRAFLVRKLARVAVSDFRIAPQERDTIIALASRLDLSRPEADWILNQVIAESPLEAAPPTGQHLELCSEFIALMILTNKCY